MDNLFQTTRLPRMHLLDPRMTAKAMRLRMRLSTLACSFCSLAAIRLAKQLAGVVFSSTWLWLPPPAAGASCLAGGLLTGGRAGCTRRVRRPQLEGRRPAGAPRPSNRSASQARDTGRGRVPIRGSIAWESMQAPLPGVPSFLRQGSDDDEHFSEVKLYDSIRDRRKWDRLSEFFAIIKTVEHLESARIKGSIEASDYTKQCSDLISQYKDAETGLVADGFIKSTADFVTEYEMQVPYAMERLVKYGVPATVLHRGADQRDEISRARQAAEATQCFITLMDALKLDQRAVDEIQPLVSDLMNRLNKCDGIPADFVGVKKATEWLVTLNGMRAAEELDDDQVRQLLHDLDISYTEFFNTLENDKK